MRKGPGSARAPVAAGRRDDARRPGCGVRFLIDDARWEALVRRLEVLEREHPKTYRRRLALLASLGYAYLLGVVAILLAAGGVAAYLMVNGVGGAFDLRIGIVLLALVGVVVRAMWVSVPAPEGFALSSGSAPALDAMIDRVRGRLGARHPDHVVLNSDFNAAAAQIPRLGVFGWPRTYLVLGLPLMQAVSVDQLEAVLAHEFGHLAGNHGKFASWIYRIRLSWLRLAADMSANKRRASFIFAWFFNWYAPYFAAYSFVLARANEYEADRASAAAVDAHTAGSAMIAVEVVGADVEAYWAEVYARAKLDERPPSDPITALSERLRAGSQADVSELTRLALERRADPDDTHPTLTERLDALGVRPSQVGYTSAPANPAVSLLGDVERPLHEWLNRDWHSQVADQWSAVRRGHQEAEAKLASYQAQHDAGVLDMDGRRAWAMLSMETRGVDATEPLFRDLLEHEPTDVLANMMLGQILLAKGDDDGLAMLEAAATADPALSDVVTQIIDAHHNRSAAPEPT